MGDGAAQLVEEVALVQAGRLPGFQNLLQHVTQVGKLAFVEQDAHVDRGLGGALHRPVQGPGFEHAGRLDVADPPQIGQLHGPPDQPGAGRRIVSRLQLGQVPGDGVLDLTDEIARQRVQGFAEATHVARRDRVVEIGVALPAGQVPKGALRIGVVLAAFLGLEMDRVDRDAPVPGHPVETGGGQVGGAGRIGCPARPRVGDQNDIAGAELAPGGALERHVDPGHGVFVEVHAGDPGDINLLHLSEGFLGVLVHGQRREDLGHVAKLRPEFGAVPIADQPEAHAVLDVRTGDPVVDLPDRFAGPRDVGLHGDRGVDDEEHPDVEVLQGVLIGGRTVRRLFLQGDRSHMEHPRQVTGLQEAQFCVQDREEIELPGDVHMLGRLDRDHRARRLQGASHRLAPVARHEGDHGLRVQDLLQRVAAAKEQGPLPARRIGEGAHHGVAPGNHLIAPHPTLGGTVRRLAHLKPVRAALRLAVEDIEHGERCDGPAHRGGLGARRSTDHRVRPAEHPLQECLLAVHQKRATGFGRRDQAEQRRKQCRRDAQGE